MSRQPRYFSHYWGSSTFGWHEPNCEGEPWDHTAGDLFQKKGIQVGDVLYGWSFNGGRLLLMARMSVGRFVSQDEADARYDGEGGRAWPAEDHILASPDSGTAMRFAREVPDHLARQLTFLSPVGDIKGPALNRSGNLDHQTFRGVRELTAAGAAILDDVIVQNP